MSKPSPNRITKRNIALAIALFGAIWIAYLVASDDLAPNFSPPQTVQTNATQIAASDNHNHLAKQINSANEPMLKDKIKALEDSGALPKLDRTSDIRGPDANNNGVRDDIDAWIAALPITEAQKKAASQAAIGLQNTLLVDIADKTAMDASGNETMASVKCLRLVFMPNYEDGYKLSAKIEAITANTKERTKQYIKYNRAASGSSTRMPEGNTCK